METKKGERLRRRYDNWLAISPRRTHENVIIHMNKDDHGDFPAHFLVTSSTSDILFFQALHRVVHVKAWRKALRPLFLFAQKKKRMKIFSVKLHARILNRIPFALMLIQFEDNPIDLHDLMRVTVYSFTWLNFTCASKMECRKRYEMDAKVKTRKR